MSCIGGLGFTTSVTILGSAINYYNAFQEHEIYKEQKSSLEGLADTNMDAFRALHALDVNVKSLHSGIYSQFNDLPTVEGCCEDSNNVIPSIVSTSMQGYQDALEEISGYQSGLKSALYAKSSRIVGKAVAQQARVFNRDQRLQWMTENSKVSAIAGSSAPNRGHFVPPSVLSGLAENIGGTLSDASTLTSAFSREAFRDIGFAWALNQQNRGSIPQTAEQVAEIEATTAPTPIVAEPFGIEQPTAITGTDLSPGNDLLGSDLF